MLTSSLWALSRSLRVSTQTNISAMTLSIRSTLTCTVTRQSLRRAAQTPLVDSLTLTATTKTGRPVTPALTPHRQAMIRALIRATIRTVILTAAPMAMLLMTSQQQASYPLRQAMTTTWSLFMRAPLRSRLRLRLRTSTTLSRPLTVPLIRWARRA